jgi:hypothetical protein
MPTTPTLVPQSRRLEKLKNKKYIISPIQILSPRRSLSANQTFTETRLLRHFAYIPILLQLQLPIYSTTLYKSEKLSSTSIAEPISQSCSNAYILHNLHHYHHILHLGNKTAMNPQYAE